MLRLCSASSTRMAILEKAGIDFVPSPIDFDEEAIVSTSAASLAYFASKGKMELAKSIFGVNTQLLTADTVIEGPNGAVLGKAGNMKEAEESLRLLSGARISISTCVHLNCSRYLFVDLSSTHYSFAPFDEDDMRAFLESGEWEGKAGACMVEGFCKAYILEVDGLESTAMGLQIEKILPWLEI